MTYKRVVYDNNNLLTSNIKYLYISNSKYSKLHNKNGPGFITYDSYLKYDKFYYINGIYLKCFESVRKYLIILNIS